MPQKPKMPLKTSDLRGLTTRRSSVSGLGGIEKPVGNLTLNQTAINRFADSDKQFHSKYKGFGRDPADKFLWEKSAQETSLGRNLNHEKNSKNPNNTAVGSWGLLPQTAKELGKQARESGFDSHNMQAFRHLSLKETADYLKKNPQAELEAVRALHNKIASRADVQGNPDKIAYLWRWGQNATIPPDYMQDETVQHRLQHEKINPLRQAEIAQRPLKFINDLKTVKALPPKYNSKESKMKISSVPNKEMELDNTASAPESSPDLKGVISDKYNDFMSQKRQEGLSAINKETQSGDTTKQFFYNLGKGLSAEPGKDPGMVDANGFAKLRGQVNPGLYAAPQAPQLQPAAQPLMPDGSVPMQPGMLQVADAHPLDPKKVKDFQKGFDGPHEDYWENLKKAFSAVKS